MRPRQTHNRRVARRRGAIIVELIITLPVLIILLFAVVEFGLILALSKQVSFASRFAARIASRESRSTLDGVNTSSGGSRLLTAVNQHLLVSDIQTGACQVTLQHNVATPSNPTRLPVAQTDGPQNCPNCTVPQVPLPIAPITCGPDPTAGGDEPDPESVRVTVCVPAKGNIPDLLCTFGFPLDDCVLQASSTFRFQDCQ